MEENLIMAKSLEYDEIVYGIGIIAIDNYRAYLIKKDFDLEIVWKASLCFLDQINNSKDLKRTLKI